MRERSCGCAEAAANTMLDGELGSLTGDAAVVDAFRYCRYNQPFTNKDVQQAVQNAP